MYNSMEHAHDIIKACDLRLLLCSHLASESLVQITGFQPVTSNTCQRLIPVRAVGSLLVVELPPLRDQDLRLRPISASFSIQQFFMQLAVKPCHESVLPKTAWRNQSRSNIQIPQPWHDLVRADISRFTIQAHQPGLGQDDILQTQAG